MRVKKVRFTICNAAASTILDLRARFQAGLRTHDYGASDPGIPLAGQRHQPQAVQARLESMLLCTPSLNRPFQVESTYSSGQYSEMMIQRGEACCGFVGPLYCPAAHLCLWAEECQEAIPACCCVLNVGHEQAQQSQSTSKPLRAAVADLASHSSTCLCSSPETCSAAGEAKVCGSYEFSVLLHEAREMAPAMHVCIGMGLGWDGRKV